MSKKKNKHLKKRPEDVKQSSALPSLWSATLGGVPKRTPSEEGKRMGSIHLFLFLFACGLYINTLTHDFAFDDSVVITGNKYTKQGFEGIKTLVTTDLFYGIYGNALDLEGGRWRPLTLAMFAIEYHFFGDNAHPYHFINILLYGITAVVLFITLLQLFASLYEKGGGEALAFITTLFFIAHPIHTEVVANIKSRDELLSFLFLCFSLFFLFKAIKQNSSPWGRIGGASLFFFLALLSKENGITFLAVIPLALFCFGRKSAKQCLTLTIPFLIVAGIYIAIRTSLVGMIGDRTSDDLTDNPFLKNNFPALPAPVPFAEKLATVSWILLKYIFLFIYPHPLSSDYGYNQIPILSFSNPKAIASVIIHLSLFLYALKILWDKGQGARDKGQQVINDKSGDTNYRQIFAFAILYHLFTISIVSNLFFLIGTTMGERFVFTTSLGFCLALSSLLLRIPIAIGTNVSNYESVRNILKNAKLLLLLAIIIIPYSIKTITRNPVWKNNKALFTEDVKTSSGSSTAHYYFANTLFTSHINDEPSPKRDSLFLEARKEFHRALEINPYFHYCYYNIGLIYEKFNQPDSAIVWQQKAIELKPENTMAQYMAKGALGLVYGKLKGDIDRAMPLLQEALRYKPDDAGFHENLGICYAMKGNYDASIKEFETALGLKPEIKKEDARTFLNLALSYQSKGNAKKAEENFQKAFALDPSLKK